MSGQKAIPWNRITNTAMPTLSILRRLFAAIRIKITLRLDNILENNISVVIPVYKAAAFVTRAVESAIEQPETAEVILIEDGSDDNSFEVCTSLVEKYNKVKLYRHPGNANKGAGLSRNLGIEKSSGEYIAFLDADDYFLPERFTAERILFAKDKTIDGVYGALGFHYYSEEGKRKYKERGYDELTTISSRIPSAEVPFSFIHLHDRARGQFHLDTLTLKKEVFAGKTEWFNSYAMHEDTAFLVQLSINCRLEPVLLIGLSPCMASMIITGSSITIPKMAAGYYTGNTCTTGRANTVRQNILRNCSARCSCAKNCLAHRRYSGFQG